MDKINRILLMYSRLLRGEQINKLSFCMETDSNPRSFDRDIEDIRLYMAEMFQSEELLYDRRKNVYFFSGSPRKELELMEYYFLERLIIDSRILREDETKGLLSHLMSNTENSSQLISHKHFIDEYIGPNHNKAILKMQGDLATIIKKKAVIKIKYIKATEEVIDCTVIPCALHFELEYMYLIAYKEQSEKQYPAYFRLDRIYSFSIVRSQSSVEKTLVDKYYKKYNKGLIQMYGGEFVEIILKCNKKFYSYVYDKFKNMKITEETEEYVIIKLSTFDDGFIKWILGQPLDMITVIQPESLKRKIAMQAEKIYKQYKEVPNDGKED